MISKNIELKKNKFLHIESINHEASVKKKKLKNVKLFAY